MKMQANRKGVLDLYVSIACFVCPAIKTKATLMMTEQNGVEQGPFLRDFLLPQERLVALWQD